MKASALVFLEVEDVELAHAQGLETAERGASGVRSRELLESAVMAPRSSYYGTLADLAAAYVFGIVKNHPFVDGNKRAGFISGLLFLELNGRALSVGNEWITVIEDVARGEMTRAELADRFAAELPGGGPVYLVDG